MSKLKQIQGKLLGKLEQVLEAVKSPEDIAKLTPEEKQTYLSALDEVFGPKEHRMRMLGYNPEKPLVENTAQEQFKYSDNPVVAKLLEKFGTKGETVFVEGLDGRKAINIDDPVAVKKILEEAYPDRKSVGPTPTMRALKQKSELEAVPLYDPVTGTYDIPSSARVRDIDAAFDPRFRHSKNRMAGLAAIPGAQLTTEKDMSPIPFLKKAAQAYDDTKEKLAEYLSREMTLSKDKETQKDIKEALELGLDPLNLAGPITGITLESLKELLKRSEE